jgi:hypothetical protein
MAHGALALDIKVSLWGRVSLAVKTLMLVSHQGAPTLGVVRGDVGGRKEAPPCPPELPRPPVLV